MSKASIKSASRIAALVLAGLAAALVVPRAAWAELQLVMVEEPGCIYCARWNAEIAPEYPVTPEGRAAPLRRINRLRPLPEDLSLASRPVYTPTFILVSDGTELGRIEGYAGEDFFWFLLGRLLEEGDADWATREVTQ